MVVHLAKSRASYPRLYSRFDLARLLHLQEEFIEAVVAAPKDFYRYFVIPKRTGGNRPIQPPIAKLKTLQRDFLAICYRRLRVPSYLHGGLPKRSPVSHASPHVGKRMVVTLDIKDFYPSTTPELIKPVLRQAGFFGQALTDLIALLTLNEGLAQGSPTSCFLANMALVLEERLNLKWCHSHDLEYTRFVDDIAISGDWDFTNQIQAFISRIEVGPYRIAPAKVFARRQGQRQIVTGLVVNDKLRPTKAYIAQLKHDIWLSLEFGAEQIADAEGTTVAKLKNRLNGRIAHLRRFDDTEARHLSDLMYGIDWSNDLHAGESDELADLNTELSCVAGPS
jgi:RNA-directed DNA polymerase